MSIRLISGDCRDILTTLADQSVQCVVTSPPYFGLRDYGTATWEGGAQGCDHLMPPAGIRNNGRDRAASDGKFHDSPIVNQISQQFRNSCGKCGAQRSDSQIGLEATPEAFVAELVQVFREVRRVLRDDGTLWLNLGDSYASGEVGRHDHKQAAGICSGDAIAGRSRIGNGMGDREQRKLATGLPSKNLIGIPWRVAFALQADGWYLRQDIIWSKPNPMPESVQDRCTKAHEYVFLLSKRARYFYDAAAIAEDGSGRSAGNNGPHPGAGQNDPLFRTREGFAAVADKEWASRNKRSVWTIATAPFGEAHFATFPPELAETCIKAGCPKGGMVLDPFAGAGTTGLVADRLQRNAVLIELSAAYSRMGEARIRADAGMFAEMV